MKIKIIIAVLSLVSVAVLHQNCAPSGSEDLGSVPGPGPGPGTTNLTCNLEVYTDTSAPNASIFNLGQAVAFLMESTPSGRTANLEIFKNNVSIENTTHTTINSYSKTFSGTTQVGSYRAELRVNSSGRTCTDSFNFTIQDPNLNTPVCNFQIVEEKNPYVIGEQVRFNYSLTNSTAPVTFEVRRGTTLIASPAGVSGGISSYTTTAADRGGLNIKARYTQSGATVYCNPTAGEDVIVDRLVSLSTTPTASSCTVGSNCNYTLNYALPATRTLPINNISSFSIYVLKNGQPNAIRLGNGGFTTSGSGAVSFDNPGTYVIKTIGNQNAAELLAETFNNATSLSEEKEITAASAGIPVGTMTPSANTTCNIANGQSTCSINLTVSYQSLSSNQCLRIFDIPLVNGVPQTVSAVGGTSWSGTSGATGTDLPITASGINTSGKVFKLVYYNTATCSGSAFNNSNVIASSGNLTGVQTNTPAATIQIANNATTCALASGQTTCSVNAAITLSNITTQKAALYRQNYDASGNLINTFYKVACLNNPPPNPTALSGIGVNGSQFMIYSFTSATNCTNAASSVTGAPAGATLISQPTARITAETNSSGTACTTPNRYPTTGLVYCTLSDVFDGETTGTCNDRGYCEFTCVNGTFRLDIYNCSSCPQNTTCDPD